MRIKKGVVACVAVLASAGVVAGCGGSDGDSGSEGDTVKIGVILDETGAAGFAGAAARKGFESTIKQINDAGGIDGKTVEATYEDAATDLKQAPSLASRMVRDDDIKAIVFGTQGSEALAIAPIVEREEVPTVFLYSAADQLMESGEHIFRVTAPQSTYTNLMTEHLAEKGVKSVSIVYTEESSTLNGLANDTYPELAKEAGIEIKSNDGVPATSTNFQSFTTKVMKDQPDAVVLLLAGASNVNAITSLQRAGYEGDIVGQPGIAGGILEPLGDKADGIVYTLDFAATTEQPVGAKFVKDFSATGDPNTYSAAGFDAATMLAKGIENGGGTSREDIQKGLDQVTKDGIELASGPVEFEGHDARVPGVLVEWKGGKEEVIAGGGQ